MQPMNRRSFLRHSLCGMGVAGTGGLLAACGSSGPGQAGGISGGRGPGNIARLGPLVEIPELGVMVPQGFTAQAIATANQPVGTTGYVWHTDPDGGATFAKDDGGFYYVSNREFVPGGVSSLEFDADGNVVNAFSIASGTQVNCAGGPTPWGTWITCEEFVSGYCWECDPAGPLGAFGPVAMRLPQLGKFNHEAIAVDPRTNIIYLTEDQNDGLFYRWVPAVPNVGGRPDFNAGGQLQAMRVETDQDNLRDDPENTASGPWSTSWVDVPNPEPIFPLVAEETGGQTPIREELADTTSAFEGGEGIWYQDGVVYFATKGDWRVWGYDIDTGMIQILYYGKSIPEESRILTNVDNVVMTPGGDIIVVEDGGNMEANAILPDGSVRTIFRVLGQDDSEITGPAFSPDGRHFFASSQRGTAGQTGVDGITYMITGDWF